MKRFLVIFLSVFVLASVVYSSEKVENKSEYCLIERPTTAANGTKGVCYSISKAPNYIDDCFLGTTVFTLVHENDYSQVRNVFYSDVKELLEENLNSGNFDFFTLSNDGKRYIIVLIAIED